MFDFFYLPEKIENVASFSNLFQLNAFQYNALKMFDFQINAPSIIRKDTGFMYKIINSVAISMFWRMK